MILLERFSNFVIQSFYFVHCEHIFVACVVDVAVACERKVKICFVYGLRCYSVVRLVELCEVELVKLYVACIV